MKKILCAAAIAAVLTMQSSFGGYAAADEMQGRNTLKGAALAVSGGVTIELYLDIKDRSFTEFVLDGPNGQKKIPLDSVSSLLKGEHAGLYRLSYPVTMQQLGEQVTLSLSGAGGNCPLYKADGQSLYEGNTAKTSVRSYIDKVNSDSSAKQALKALVNALDAYSKKNDAQMLEKYKAAIQNYSKASNDGSTIDRIEIKDTDGQGCNYAFSYGGMDFKAEFTVNSATGKENWKIIDSYRVRSKADMEVICQALIDLHPVHGKDMVSFRTAKDMAEEWDLHNLAYDVLPEGRQRERAKDVDLDPDDQGRTLTDFIKKIASGS